MFVVEQSQKLIVGIPERSGLDGLNITMIAQVEATRPSICVKNVGKDLKITKRKRYGRRLNDTTTNA